jgi:hypothetical protein
MLYESIRSCQLYQIMATNKVECKMLVCNLVLDVTMSGIQPNGTINQPQSSKAPPVVGINFGNSYASIAVLNKVWTVSNPWPVA